MEKPQLSNWQLMVLISGTTLGCLNTMLFVWLERLYPGKTLMDIHKSVLGRGIGTFLNIFFIIYFFEICAWTLREFADFLLITVEPATPIFAYLTIGMIMAGYAVYYGVEVIARIAELMMPLVVFSYLTVFSLTVNLFHLSNLQPILENGLLHPLHDPFLTISWFGDVMVISMLMGYVRRTEKTWLFILLRGSCLLEAAD